tara:strand:- start:623 stop:2407 length:1785 start_codon:yes stop_codon:yes gene_type:complete
MSDNTINTDNIITRRVIQLYDDKTIKLIKKKRKRFNLDLSIAADERPNDKLFKNQRATATLIVSDLEDGTLVFIGVVGETQSGKTGTMIATIKQYMKKNIIPIENIYIITGLSDIMWCKQTKERVPDSIMDRVFHRSDLLNPKFLDEIKNKKNVLILMDEVHLAAKEKQTIYKCFNAAGLLDKENLFKNDIKIIQFTATPDGIYGDLNNWNNGSKIIISKPSANYTSSKDLVEQKRVFQYKPLVTEYDYNREIFDMLYDEHHTDSQKKKMLRRIKRITEFINIMTPHQGAETAEQQLVSILEKKKIPERFIQSLIHIAKRQLNILKNINDIRLKIIRLNIHRKLYHIIRTPNGDNNIQDNFKNIFDENDYCFVTYDQSNKELIDLNVLLKKKPQKHTFIFIKEKLRCAKTLCKTYLGIFYERYTKSPNDSTIIQGGLGRLTGYDDNGFSLCYTNIESIHKYRRILDNEFTDLSGWNSATTNKRKKVKTFNDESLYQSDSETSEPDISSEAIFIDDETDLRWQTDHNENAPNRIFNIRGSLSLIDCKWCHIDGRLRTMSNCPPVKVTKRDGGIQNVLVYKDENSNEWTVRKMMYQ